MISNLALDIDTTLLTDIPSLLPVCSPSKKFYKRSCEFSDCDVWIIERVLPPKRTQEFVECLNHDRGAWVIKGDQSGEIFQYF